MPKYIHTIKQNQPSKSIKCSVIIPAAGIGWRIQSYGPKSLLQITPNINIITHQLNTIHKALNGNYEIVLVTGYKSEQIMNLMPNNIIQVENERYETTNVVRSLGIGLRAATSNRVIIIYGDLVFNIHALNFPRRSKSYILIDKSGYMTNNEVGCTIVDDKLQHMIYDLPNKWAQILYLTGDELSLFKEICWDKTNENTYTFEALNKMIEHGSKIYAISPPKMKVNDVDCMKDMFIARKILRCRN